MLFLPTADKSAIHFPNRFSRRRRSNDHIMKQSGISLIDIVDGIVDVELAGWGDQVGYAGDLF